MDALPIGQAMSTGWQSVNRHDPCPACGGTDRCARSTTTGNVSCFRDGETPEGMERIKTTGDAVVFGIRRPESRNGHARKLHQPRREPTNTPPATNWASEYDRLAESMTDERWQTLADALTLPLDAVKTLPAGWADADDLRRLRVGGDGWSEDRPPWAWCFAERDGKGRIVGVSFRAEDGRKGFAKGSGRGLTVPSVLHEHDGPVLIVEGASDVAACAALGLPSVGRPSNLTGGEAVAELLQGRDVLVLGERDGKADGRWPGRDGAVRVAETLARKWGEAVPWALPPKPAKDVRGWAVAKLAGGGDAAEAGRELMQALDDGARLAKPHTVSTADQLVRLAHARYRIGRSESGEAFAVERGGPNIALMLRGSRDALRSSLARAYREAFGRTPNASALGDALVVLEGDAGEADAEPVALRVADAERTLADAGDSIASAKTVDKNPAHGSKTPILGEADAADAADAKSAQLSDAGGLVLDLGDTEGRAVVIEPGRWSLVDSSPTLFRRTALSGTLPEPAASGDLGELRDLLNVTDDGWPLLVGWLVAAMMPEPPHPVLMLGGEQGTGKSTTARRLVGLVDPSPAPLRSEPRDAEGWAMTAAGSWAVCVDNVSGIPGWWSDSLCKCVTGDGWVRRKLYSDNDLSVLTFKRCVIITSIDAGSLRGDLGDRLMLIDLERITDSERRTEAELDDAYEAARPRLLAGLLDATARTLAALPDVKLDAMPRMADFARVLAALDTACPELTDGQAFDRFAGQRDRIAAEVVDADPLAAAIVELLDETQQWEGTANELLDKLTPKAADGSPKPPRGWPKDATRLAGRLKRARPALEAVGVTIEDERTGKARTRLYTLSNGGRALDSVRSVRQGEKQDVNPCDNSSPEADAKPPHSVRLASANPPTASASDPDWAEEGEI